MYQSEQINELASALSKMQQQVGTIGKNKTAKIPMKSGGSFSFSYADLAGIIDATRHPMAENGLSFTQTFAENGHSYHMVSTLLHSSGQWIKSVLPINVAAVDIKQLGAQITYSRRYALTALLGICADDDAEDALEGNAVSKASPPAPLPAQKPVQPVFITKVQADELDYMLKGCEPSYQTQFWAFLKKEAPSVTALSHLPVTMYPRIKAAIGKKYDEANAEDEVAHV